MYIDRKALFKCEQWLIQKPDSPLTLEPKIGFHLLLFIFGNFCSGIFIARRKLCKFYQWAGNTGGREGGEE